MKNHPDVLRDIRTMVQALEIVVSRFAAMCLDAYGRPQPMLNLPHRETMILLIGYSVPTRAKVVDRWTRPCSESLMH